MRGRVGSWRVRGRVGSERVREREWEDERESGRMRGRVGG